VGGAIKAYKSIKTAKWKALGLGIGIAVAGTTGIVLSVIDDEEEGDGEDDDNGGGDDNNGGDDNKDSNDNIVTDIEDENHESLNVVNSAVVTASGSVLTSFQGSADSHGGASGVIDYIVVNGDSSDQDINATLAEWFPEFAQLQRNNIRFTSPNISFKGVDVLAGGNVTFMGYSDSDDEMGTYDVMGDSLVFDKLHYVDSDGNETGDTRTSMVISRQTIRMRAKDMDVLGETIIAGRGVDIMAEDLEISGDSYVVSTRDAALKVENTTTVDSATMYLRGLSGKNSVGEFRVTRGSNVVLIGATEENASKKAKLSAKSVSLDASNLMVKEMTATVSGDTTVSNGSKLTVADASYSTDSLKVESGSTLVNKDGTISSSSTITVSGGTVQGSGTFSAITLNSGKLVVGNSPGLQVFTGDLVLGDAEMLFSVGDFETVASVGVSGWDANVYSSVNMDGHRFTLGENAVITLAFGGTTLDTLGALVNTDDSLSFSFTLLQNVTFFTEAELSAMLGQTRLLITSEDEGLPSGAKHMAGKDITEYTFNSMKYELVEGSKSGSYNVVLSGTFGKVDVIPEPATATLSLLALAALAARRRRK
jgi:hypothetical protein